MKRLHRSDLYGWSQFNTERNIDFHSILWVRDQGNVMIDPLPLSNHDKYHLDELGGVATIILTNSDHVRATAEIVEQTAARVLGPSAERDGFPIDCSGWLEEGDEVAPHLQACALDGSKTPGELALVLEGTTLITGDLIRAHEGGRLCLLPDAKIADKAAAIASVSRLAELRQIDAVLPGDGWPVFRDGSVRLRELVSAITT